MDSNFTDGKFFLKVRCESGSLSSAKTMSIPASRNPRLAPPQPEKKSYTLIFMSSLPLDAICLRGSNLSLPQVAFDFGSRIPTRPVPASHSPSKPRYFGGRAPCSLTVFSPKTPDSFPVASLSCNSRVHARNSHARRLLSGAEGIPSQADREGSPCAAESDTPDHVRPVLQEAPVSCRPRVRAP